MHRVPRVLRGIASALPWTGLSTSRAAFAVLAAFAAFGSRPAEAGQCDAPLSSCINDDAFWPHAGPATFVAVGAARTVAARQIAFGLVTSYLSRPIVFAVPSPSPRNGTRESAVENQVNGTFLWAYGVTRSLQLDVAVPVTFGQNGAGLEPIRGGGALRDTAVRDIRFGFAYQLLSWTPTVSAAPVDPVEEARRGPPAGWGLVGRLEVSAPTGDEDQFAGEHSGVFVPAVSGEYRLSGLFVGAELGARLRPTAQLLDARVGSQLVASLGVGYDILPRRLLSAALEAWALPTLVSQDTLRVVQGAYVGTPGGGSFVPAEWQLSARSAPAGGGAFSVQLSGGGGIPFGGELPVTTPRFRFVLGLRWDGGLDSHR